LRGDALADAITVYSVEARVRLTPDYDAQWTREIFISATSRRLDEAFRKIPETKIPGHNAARPGIFHFYDYSSS